MRRKCRERFPRHILQRKPFVSDPGMHHGTCVTHVPWCMSGLLTHGGGVPAHAQTVILRICQAAHAMSILKHFLPHPNGEGTRENLERFDDFTFHPWTQDANFPWLLHLHDPDVPGSPCKIIWLLSCSYDEFCILGKSALLSIMA